MIKGKAYCSRPYIVNAVQFTAENSKEFIGLPFVCDHLCTGTVNDYLKINTLNGVMEVSVGDWVMENDKKQAWVMPDRKFTEIFEEISRVG